MPPAPPPARRPHPHPTPRLRQPGAAAAAPRRLPAGSSPASARPRPGPAPIGKGGWTGGEEAQGGGKRGQPSLQAAHLGLRRFCGCILARLGEHARQQDAQHRYGCNQDGEHSKSAHLELCSAVMGRWKRSGMMQCEERRQVMPPLMAAAPARPSLRPHCPGCRHLRPPYCSIVRSTSCQPPYRPLSSRVVGASAPALLGGAMTRVNCRH